MRIRRSIGNVEIRLNTDRFDNGFREGQKALNLQVAADCDPYIPFQQGQLKNSLVYPDGIYGGALEWNATHAHYQYVGEVYGPNIPIRDSEGNITGWYSPPIKHPIGRKLTYHTPGTGSEWFEEAKKKEKKNWVSLVDRKVKGR